MYSDQPGGLAGVCLVLVALLFLAALGMSFWRMLRGPSAFDRVLALDLVGSLCLCLIVIFAMVFDQEVLLDAAVAIAVVSFLGTVAFAGYLGRGGAK